MSLMNHEAGRDCLLELNEVLRSLELPYFLMQGTALGAYRDRGFTPTERDIDLGFLYERFAPTRPALVDRLLHCGYDVEQFVMPFNRVRTLVVFKKFGSHIIKADLVAMIRWGKERFTCPPLRDYLERPYALVHRARVVENYSQTEELWGQHFTIPHMIEDYLTAEYGLDWKTPRDDHVSRTRMYNYVELEGIPRDYLEQWG